MKTLFPVSLGFVVLLHYVACSNKYSEELNSPRGGDDTKNLLQLENPFRMQKINVLWEKAKRRLSEGKLKTLFADLKSQDKDELGLKKLKSEGQDKEGVKEATLRKQLRNIMNKYGLTDPWNNADDNETAGKYQVDDHSIQKALFKDKKLNKLWLKAEQVGLSDEQLKTLKEEFQHHQEKIEQYFQLMDKVNQPNHPDDEEFRNSIDLIVEETGEQKIAKSLNQPMHQMLKEKHKQIKQGYDYLIRQVSDGIESKEFEESAVQQLWEMAEKADFTLEELSSLKEELHHYEHRMKKLRHFQAELDLSDAKLASNKLVTEEESGDHQKHLQKKVKEIEYKVSKIHNELERRIVARHSEL